MNWLEWSITGGILDTNMVASSNPTSGDWIHTTCTCTCTYTYTYTWINQRFRGLHVYHWDREFSYTRNFLESWNPRPWIFFFKKKRASHGTICTFGRFYALPGYKPWTLKTIIGRDLSFCHRGPGGGGRFSTKGNHPWMNEERKRLKGGGGGWGRDYAVDHKATESLDIPPSLVSSSLPH